MLAAKLREICSNSLNSYAENLIQQYRMVKGRVAPCFMLPFRLKEIDIL